MKSDSSCHLETDSMMCKYDLLMTCFPPLPARYWYTLAEVQCFRSFNVVHHGNWFAPVRWRLGIRKQHQNGVVSPFLQLCQKLTIQVVKRDRTDVKMLNVVLKKWRLGQGTTLKLAQTKRKNMEDSGVCVRTIIWQPLATATFRSWTTLVVGIRRVSAVFAFPSLGRS